MDAARHDHRYLDDLRRRHYGRGRAPIPLARSIWAIGGAVLLIVVGLLPVGAAWGAIGKSADVYLFFSGMMLLREIAREQGRFDWVAATAAINAKGSRSRLFLLV